MGWFERSDERKAEECECCKRVLKIRHRVCQNCGHLVKLKEQCCCGCDDEVIEEVL